MNKKRVARIKTDAERMSAETIEILDLNTRHCRSPDQDVADRVRGQRLRIKTLFFGGLRGDGRMRPAAFFISRSSDAIR